MRGRSYLLFCVAVAALGVTVACGGGCGGTTTASAPPPAVDAGPDANAGIAPDPPRVKDSGPTYCQKNAHTFCADFDADPDGYTAGWDFDQSSTSARMETIASDRSAPYALHIVGDAYTPSDGGFVDPSAFLDKAIQGIDPSKVHLSFDVRIDALGVPSGQTTTPVGIAGIGVYQSSSFEEVGNLELEVSPTKTFFYPYFVDSKAPNPDATLDDLPRGRWVHVDIAMNGTPSATHVEVLYDGGPAGSFDFGAGSYRGDMVDLHVGAIRPYRPDATSIAFDNVVLDL